MKFRSAVISIFATVALASISLLSPAANASDESNNPVNADSSNNIRSFEFDGPRGTLDAPTAGIERMPVKGAAVTATGIAGTITNHGGPVIVNPKVYVIWYGTWGANPCTQTGTTSPSVLNTFLKNVGGSPWYNMNTSYYQDVAGVRTHVTPSVTWGGCTADAGSLGKTLDTTAANSTSQVVASAITSNALPSDANALYYVLTSSDISVSGFGTSFCGYHGYFSQGATNIKYSFVGDATKYGASCGVGSISPNSNPAADAMASVIGHELVEAVSDPLLNAWYDSRGNENADKCAWIFGTTSSLPSGAIWNTTLGSSPFLLQQNWIVNGGTCYTALPALSATVSNIAVNTGKAMTSTIPVLPIGGNPGYTFTVSIPDAATLASHGLGLNSSTGAVTGTPVGGGTFPVTVTVTDLLSATTSGVVNIQITSPLTVTSAISGTKIFVLGTAVSPAVTTVTASGGTGALTYSISPALPAGLLFSASTGVITGIPTTAKAARNYTVTVQDTLKASKSATVSLRVQ